MRLLPRPQTEKLPAASDIALVAQSVTVEHTGAQGREEFISPEAVQTEVDELPTLKSKERPIV